MYNLYAYGLMINDSSRMMAYAEALKNSIGPDTSVLDIGTGTGIFALLACSYGAKKVYAIEPSDLIRVASEIAKAIGFEDRIEFIQNISTQVELPEKADIIVSDLRGILPLWESNILSIADARKRFLKPDGLLIPEKDTLFIALVEEGDLYQKIADSWTHNKFNLNMEPARKLAVNTIHKARIKPEQLLVEPQIWAAIDYKSIVDPNVNGTVNFIAAREGVAHGLCVWFDAVLMGEIGFSNSPSAPETIYQNMFFPLVEPVELSPGDQIAVSIFANLIGDNYVWRWNTIVTKAGTEEKVIANYSQSTFYGVPISPEKLKKYSNSWIPKLNEVGAIDLYILNQMSEGKSLEEISQKIKKRFPDYFNANQDAIERVRNFSIKYSQ